jgi:hypothetical protein
MPEKMGVRVLSQARDARDKLTCSYAAENGHIRNMREKMDALSQARKVTDKDIYS